MRTSSGRANNRINIVGTIKLCVILCSSIRRRHFSGSHLSMTTTPIPAVTGVVIPRLKGPE